jgi:hypothetical protein
MRNIKKTQQNKAKKIRLENTRKEMFMVVSLAERGKIMAKEELKAF